MPVGHSKLSVCLYESFFLFYLCITPNSDIIFSVMKAVTLRKKKNLERVLTYGSVCSFGCGPFSAGRQDVITLPRAL